MTQSVEQLPATVNLSFWRGDDVFFVVAVSDASGAPADLSGQTPAAQIRAAFTSTDIAATLETIISGNEIQCHIDNTDTAAVPAAGVWDLQLTDAAGFILTIAQGRVTVTGEVTRP